MERAGTAATLKTERGAQSSSLASALRAPRTHKPVIKKQLVALSLGPRRRRGKTELGMLASIAITANTVIAKHKEPNSLSLFSQFLEFSAVGGCRFRWKSNSWNSDTRTVSVLASTDCLEPCRQKSSSHVGEFVKMMNYR